MILDEATSALDAESETLVNEALAALLRGNNTTISIAHRLSTIKRSDTIIVLSNDGTVAEVGSYEQLSRKPDGAFTKLMEWQMSGGEPKPQGGEGASHHEMAVNGEAKGAPSEREEIEHLLGSGGEEAESDEEESKKGEEQLQEQKVAERVGDKPAT